MSSPRRGPLARTGVFLATLALALLAAESALRFLGRRTERRELFDAVRLEAAPVRPGATVTLGRIIRATGDARVYALRPGLVDVVYEGARVSTDARGFRSRPVADAKPAGTRRILGLGDSVMFGQGVEQDEPYLAQLDAALAARAGATAPCEVVNLAVPGYNTAMEVAALHAVGLELEPDLVVLGFVENDLSLPRFLLAQRDWLSPRFSILLERMGLARGGDLEAIPESGTSGGEGGVLRDAPLRGDGERQFGVERNPERVPPAYRDQVGWAAVERALDELRELSRAHGFRVLFFVHRENAITRHGLELARARGFSVLDLAPAVERYQLRHGIDELLGSALTVSATDPHPSALLHALAGRALLQAIEAEQLLGADLPQSSR